MGMYKPDFYLCRHFISIYLQLRQQSPTQTKIIELGDQIIDESIRQEFGVTTGPVAKDYFTSLGYQHISIDINGKNRALQLDLSKEIKDSGLLNQFDVLTNHGTTEHVEDSQYICWKNVHNLIKLGGFIISFVPSLEFYKEHCPWFYKKEFFAYFAEELGYKTWMLAEIRVPETWHGVLVSCVLEKQQEKPYDLDEKKFYSFLKHA